MLPFAHVVPPGVAAPHPRRRSLAERVLIPTVLALALAALTACTTEGQSTAGNAHAKSHAKPASAGAVLAADHSTSIPEGFREWVFIGAPLTPNGLNGGEAAFPEFHHVYVEPLAYAHYKRTGTFPEGTTIVKELATLHAGEYEDGSRDEVSGRGFFAHRFNGVDMMVKDTKRFPDGNGWGFYNFGHHAPPYAARANAAPVDACAFCHIDNATFDMVFTKFYPILDKH